MGGSNNTAHSPDNPLQIISDEVLISLISTFPLRDLWKLRSVCRRLRHLLEKHMLVWKRPCMEFWNERGYAKNGLSLEWAQKESSKEWIWFAKSFINSRFEFKATSVDIGAGQDGEFSFGISVGKFSISFGDFFRENFIVGTRIFKDGTSYVGPFDADLPNGMGTFFVRTGIQFKGKFKYGDCNGNGKMIYPDYQFDCKWTNDDPADKNISVHPQLQQCIIKRICSKTVTGSNYFPQWLHFCFTCDHYLCDSCFILCHPKDDHQFGGKLWSWTISCECGDAFCARKNQITSK